MSVKEQQKNNKQDGVGLRKIAQLPLYLPCGQAPSWPFLIRICSMFIIISIVFSMNVTLCAAEDEDSGTPYVILAKPGELYELELIGTSDATNLTIIFSFDYNLECSERLQVQSPYGGDNSDSLNGFYGIKSGSSLLCTIKQDGIESILLSEKRAKLTITSEDYYLFLLGIHVDQASMQFDFPVQFQIIVYLFTLLPFFLLLPDALKEFQIQLDHETASKGVYGLVLGVMLPLFTIALTLLLLGSLDFLR